MIFLDMDGVVVDFAGSALRLHGYDVTKTLANWPTGEWDIAKVLGLSDAAFWSKIDDAGEDWWATLPKYPWADELIQLVSSLSQQWLFASCPSRFHGSSSGKVRWMQNEFGLHFRKYMLGEHKHLLANPDSLLIDDNEQSVTRFRSHCGRAILFPQPWNSLGAVDNPIELIRAQLWL